MDSNKKIKQFLELLILFVGMPALLLVPIHSGIKVVIILIAVAYAIHISLKHKIVKRKELYSIPKHPNWKIIALRTALLIGLTSTFVMAPALISPYVRVDHKILLMNNSTRLFNKRKSNPSRILFLI